MLCICLILLEQLNNTQDYSLSLHNSVWIPCNLSDSDVVYIYWKTADQLCSLFLYYNRGILWRSHNHITCNAPEEWLFVHTKSAWNFYFLVIFLFHAQKHVFFFNSLFCAVTVCSFFPFHLLHSNPCGFGLPLHRSGCIVLRWQS